MNALEVSEVIINYANKENYSITNLKLQKILYFTWIDYYKSTTSYLFEDEFHAWKFGPVIPKVYSKYACYGASNIYLNKELSFHEYLEYIDSLNVIIKKYITQSAYQLVHKSHLKNSPWDKVFNSYSGNKIISYHLMIKNN